MNHLIAILLLSTFKPTVYLGFDKCHTSVVDIKEGTDVKFLPPPKPFVVACGSISNDDEVDCYYSFEGEKPKLVRFDASSVGDSLYLKGKYTADFVMITVQNGAASCVTLGYAVMARICSGNILANPD